MGNVIAIIVIFIVAIVTWKVYRQRLLVRRERLIDTFCFPAVINNKIADQYPHLSRADIEKVLAGLREYFQLCNIAAGKVVSMPSQVVDVAWHEFILFTRNYEYFCYKALGRFIHHTPAAAMSSPTLAHKGIKTAWRISCFRERIDPNSPARLPFLFAMDAELSIPDGLKYSLNCRAPGSQHYCAGHIGCSSGCAGGCSGDSGDGCGDGSGSGCGGGD